MKATLSKGAGVDKTGQRFELQVSLCQEDENTVCDEDTSTFFHNVRFSTYVVSNTVSSDV